MRLENFDAPTHYPHPLSVLGKRVDAFVEQSREILPWYRLVNEFQMFLHQHPRNAERMQQGRLAINSLWAWGAGSLPALARQPAWYCDDPILNRFAGTIGLAVASCEQLREISELDNAVIIDLRLLELLKSGSAARIDELLLDIEQRILAPVMDILRRRPVPLLLRAAYEQDFAMGRHARWRFWRRPGDLADWRASE